MNQRPSEPAAARPLRKRPRPAQIDADRPADQPGPALPRALFWADHAAMPAADPAANRPWTLATVAMLVVVVLAALGPIVSG